MNMYVGKWPGEVASIDREARIVRVRIPGVTDGAAELPEAQISYPIGDKSEHTEIRILEGDRVWIEFECGDSRYPIITGYRPKNQENGIGWRRFHHANFQFDADAQYIINAANVIVNASGSVTVNTPNATVNADQSTFNGAVTVNGPFAFNAGMTGKGGGTMTGGDLVVDGIGVVKHHHTEQGDGAPTSDAQA